MNLHYNWTLKDAVFTKDKGKVFSCFSCGGGSTMGYKLAGFDVIGCNEIDPKMMGVYIENHKPKHSFLEGIQTFAKRKDLPKELYDLDILDGSPPCSSFSMAGNREKDWGKEKVFREGQSEQVLDKLFFDFIDLAKELQPKVVIAENVKGLLMGEAKKYVAEIYKAFDLAGYYCQHFLLDASKMGVPQRRERVFFICIRKDLGEQFLEQVDLFLALPKIEMEFNEREIPFKEIFEKNGNGSYSHAPSYKVFFSKLNPGENCGKYHEKGNMHGCFRVDINQVSPTLVANNWRSRDGGWIKEENRSLSKKEYCSVGSYPQDYNFLKTHHSYLIGMSVPPLMTAKIAKNIYDQWLSKIKQ